MSGSGEVKTLRKAPTALQTPSSSDASISRMGEVELFTEDELNQRKIIYAGMPQTKMLNIFRELRTQLLQKNKKSNFVCMVSSVCHDGGCSYISTNLGAVFSLDRAKTSILIDANLYDPSVERLIIGDAQIGITDYLSDPQLDIKDIVYATGIPRLRAIPIGGYSEGAAEYFSSDKMVNFIDEIRSRYSDRFIFIDAPPITDSSEARILCDMVDMIVLVVPHGKATREQVESAIQIVGQDKLCGLVYNN